MQIRAWKKIGETPLQTLTRVQREYGIPDSVKMCYTNRLDPMAQGVITILIGDSIHTAKLHNSHDKVYRFQAILGVGTVSYDPMGRICNTAPVPYNKALQYQKEMLQYTGPIEQKLPPCSAYRYKGKPLWQHVVDGTLPAELPTKSVQVHSIKALYGRPTAITMSQYRAEALGDINDVRSGGGNFDYDNIISDWRDLPGDTLLYRCVYEVHVSSGTYVRALVKDIGDKTGIPAHAFRITRVSC